jgi:ATP-binding cassette subfamily F protein 3
VLLTGADLTLAYGRRYCLIGRNGIGKTTLLKMISSFVFYFLEILKYCPLKVKYIISSGQLKIPSHIRVLHVEQEVHGDETLAIQSVLECDIRRQELLKKEKELVERLQTE